jgi:hypothetical protein
VKPSGETRLRRALQRLGTKPAAGAMPASPKFCLDPSNPFEVAVAEQIKALREDVDELKDRLNWLFGLIIAAAIANVVLALL